MSQSGERPERYIESLRFDTMPSSPILQAWTKMVVANEIERRHAVVGKLRALRPFGVL